jgi:hypothetical protein
VGARGIEHERVGRGLRATFLAVAFVTGGATMVVACDRGGGEGAKSRAETSANSEAGGTTSTGKSVEIESSLEGLSVLPRRVRWTARTSLPADQVREVRFLIDRFRYWSDPSSPFTYGEGGASLAWVGAGAHRFTVQVIETDGSKWSEAVIARGRRTHRGRRFYGIWFRLSPAEQATPSPRRQLPHPTAVLIFLGRDSLWVGRSNLRAFWYDMWMGATPCTSDRKSFSVGPGSTASPVAGIFEATSARPTGGRPHTRGRSGRGDLLDGSTDATTTRKTSFSRPRESLVRTEGKSLKACGRELTKDRPPPEHAPRKELSSATRFPSSSRSILGSSRESGPKSVYSSQICVSIGTAGVTFGGTT